MTALDSPRPQIPLPLRIAAFVAVAFGALTIVSGGTALFGGPAARAAVGDAVPFVLWFNFLAGSAYIAAGIGLWQQRRWAARLALTLSSFVWLAIAGLAIKQKKQIWGG